MQIPQTVFKYLFNLQVIGHSPKTHKIIKSHIQNTLQKSVSKYTGRRMVGWSLTLISTQSRSYHAFKGIIYCEIQATT